MNDNEIQERINKRIAELKSNKTQKILTKEGLDILDNPAAYIQAQSNQNKRTSNKISDEKLFEQMDSELKSYGYDFTEKPAKTIQDVLTDEDIKHKNSTISDILNLKLERFTEVILELVLGFIFMLILTILSSIPIFATGCLCKNKGGYPKWTAWTLTLVCILLYIVLRLAFYELMEVPSESVKAVPILAMLIIYGFANIYTTKNKSTTENKNEDTETVKICTDTTKQNKLNFFVRLKAKIKEYFKKIFKLCKTDVFYTLVFGTALYLIIYSILIIFEYAEIEYSDEYTPSFIICKWLVFISSSWIFYKKLKENNKSNLLFFWGIITVIFNTIFKIPFDVEQWVKIVIISGIVYFAYSIILIKKNNNSEQ